jgi:ATP-dependent Clp protease ATP-binding subunit ClpA
MARVIQTELKDRLADDLLFGPLAKGGRVTADLDGDRLVFRIES